MHFLALLLTALPAFASCPKTLKEWRKEGPKIFLEKASLQRGPVEIEDFSARLGKKQGATASAFPFQQPAGEFVMVKVNDEKTSLFLSGILKCDEISHEPVLLSLSYVKGKQNGLIPVTTR